PLSNLWLLTDDALTDFRSLKETEVAVSLPRLQLEIERLRRPETMNVAHRDLFASERIVDAAPRHIGAGKAFKNAHALVIAKADDVIIFAEGMALGCHEIDHRLNLEELCAPAFSPVRKPLLAVNEGLMARRC